MNILDKLTNKVLAYSANSLLEWWGPEVAADFGNRCPPTVEWDDYGYFVTDINHIIYVHCGLGRLYRLTLHTVDKDTDWSMHQKLYIKVLQHMKVKIDVPLDRKIVEVGGKFYEYTETMFPGNGNGEWIMDPNDRIVTEDLIVKFKEIYKNLIEVYNENGMIGIPLLTISNYYKDQNDYFVLSGQSWNKKPQVAIEELINSFKLLILNQPQFLPQVALDTASQEWRSLL